MRDTIYSVEVDGQVIEASSEHPFYVQGEWKETKNLDVGDKLTLFNHDCESSIASIKIEARRDTVYNLSVADFETYFVSELGILVHNCGGKLQKVNGRNPINGKKYAGKTYKFDKGSTLAKDYPRGIKFSEEGFPDFRPHSEDSVDIGSLNKTSGQDIKLANELKGYDKTPDGMVWQHVENSTELILIPSDLHDAVRHTGGRATDGPKKKK